MITLPYFKNRRVAVLGLGRSGRYVAQALLESGAEVFAWDDQPEARDLAGKIPIHNLQDVDWSTIHDFIISPGIPHTYPAPHPCAVAAKAHGLSPVGDMECFFRSPVTAPSIIGITGTNGKSTTSALLAHVAQEAGKKVALGGNIGIPILQLPILDDQGLYVIEFSSYQLELTPSLDLDVCILLNIFPDHLDRHRGLGGYIEAKKRIFQNKRKPLKAVIGVDDPIGRHIFEELSSCPDHIVVPISANTPIKGGVFCACGTLEDDMDGTGAPFTLSFPNNYVLQGQHNAQNAAAAYAGLRLLGLSAHNLHESQGFNTFPGMPNRQEWVGCVDGISYINDSKATNADAVACALKRFVADFRDGRTLYWVAGGRLKEKDFSALAPFWNCIEEAFLIGEASETLSLHLIDQGVSHRLCQTLENACEQATSLALQRGKPAPLILLSPACTSFDQFRNFEHRGDVFRDWVLKRARG